MKSPTLFAACFSIACGSGAMAGTTNITFDNSCDGMQIVSNDNVHYVSTETGQCLNGILVMGTGYRVGKNSASHVVLGVNWEAYDGKPAGSEQHAYALQYPFVTGGAYEEILTTDGQTFSVVNTGTYTVVGEDLPGPTGSQPSFVPAR